MDGKTVVIDVDQTDLSMSTAISGLAADVLGYTPFVRVGSPPKWCRFYRADGLVSTTAGGCVEIFSAVGSKQVVIYGQYPSGREYEWVADAKPLTHRCSEVPVVATCALSDFRSEAIALCAGQVGVAPSPSIRPASLTACGGSVSGLMIDLFSRSQTAKGATGSPSRGRFSAEPFEHTQQHAGRDGELPGALRLFRSADCHGAPT
jgi:hypothetical protein